MMRFKYTLERYKGTKSRFICPQCGLRELVRYVSNETGEALSNGVGRCNRESKCGYHRTPQDYFAVHGNLSNERRNPKQRFARQPAPIKQKQSPKHFDCISADVFCSSLANYEQNAFVQWLLSEIEAADVIKAIKRYFIGTTENGRTIFWQIDEQRRIRTGKIIAYDPTTGKRRKDTKPSFVHAELKHARILPETFELNQCLFGEHLLKLEPEKRVAIVEAEKTAIIASLFFPDLIWLATSGKQQLNPDKLQPARTQQIILFPDADAFETWTEKAKDLGRASFNVRVSDLIQRRASNEEKQNGLDIADYLLQAARREINTINGAIDKVLENKELLSTFETICEERLAIAEIDGNLSPEKAFEVATTTDYLRQLAVNLT
ncbi:MAG TPA: DUF6371 domain-containing protein [Pyrinomonadaceae bacterium]|jgi:hypothetical protein